MLDKEFFSNPKKKILISDSFNNADNLIKRYVLAYKKPVANIEKVTLTSLAESLYKKYGNPNHKIIDEYAGSYIVDYLIRKNKYSFVPESSFSINTAKVFYAAILEIKYSKIKNSKNPRYLEILPLIEDYDSYLTENLLLDPADLMKKAISLVSKDALGISGEVIIGVTDNLKGKLRYLEKELLNKICEICNVFDADFISFEKDNKDIKSLKVDAHGYLNELAYIVKDIKESNYNPSDIDIFVSDSSYQDLIISLFDYHKIPYNFVNGVSIQHFSFVTVIRSVLDFLYYLCDIKYIYKMLQCDAIKDEYKELIPHLSNLKCDHYNIHCYQGNKYQPLSPELKEFLDLLLAIDGDYDIVTLFEKLTLFLQFACKEEHFNQFQESLDKIKDRLGYVDEISCPSKDVKIDIISSFLDHLSLNKIDDNNSIRIKSLDNEYVLIRKINYFIGLSASQITVKEIQSPVLDDKELMDLLDDSYYLHLSKNNNSEKMDNIYCLLDSGLPQSSLTFIYSSYDSVEFKEQAQSTLYTDIDAKEIQADYQLDEGSLYKKEETSTLDKKIDMFSFSPSDLESFFDCPYRYILEKAESFQRVDLQPYSNNWFVGGEYGSFCHLVLQYYFQTCNTKDKQKVLDKAVLDKCIEKAKEKTIQSIPFGNQHAIEMGIKTARRDVEKYLSYYFNNNEGYVVAACEYKFSEDGISEIFEIDDSNVIAKYIGFIDRIDVKIDDEGIFHVRTIDYKTTNKTKIKNKVKSGKAFQAHIYTLAAKAFCLKHKNELEKLLGKKLPFEKVEDITNITFEYILLKEKGPSQIVAVSEEQDALSQTNLKIIMKSILQYNEDFNLDNLLDNLNKNIDQAGSFGDNNCQYCSFAKHCLYKIRFGENIHLVDKKEEKDDD